MCRCIKLIIVLLIAFLAVSIWKGGDEFREMGEKTGGFLQTTFDRIADQADEIREKVRGTQKKTEEWKNEKNKKSLESIKNYKEMQKEGLFEKK